VQDKWDRLSKKNGKNSLQMDIFGADAFTPRKDDIPEGEELDYAEILKGEKEALGFYFSEHPLSAYEKVIGQITRLDTASVKEWEGSEDVTIVGIVNGIKEITTKRGDRMATVKLEDTKGMIEVVVFPDLLAKNRPVIESDRPLVVTGTLERTEDGVGRIRGKMITPLEDIHNELRKVVHIRIDCGLFKKEHLRKLRDILAGIRGDSRVCLEFRQNGDRRTFDVPDIRIDAGKTDVVLKYFASGITIEVAK
jgi:DNA polymerase-3 subunit alpha